MYAVVATGGKQEKVFVDDTIRVEKIDAPIGETVELSPVRLLVKDEGIVSDPAALVDAKVICHVVKQDRGRKIRVYKRKRKNNYNRMYGHRQPFTELKVVEIAG
ncbi:MAG: 50S ribosomal protein L21 [Candidatus Hydrogenedentes bacterium]|nr:50S ribosomal protein L21 [Candidatus Hydrogenedentota bacterium]